MYRQASTVFISPVAFLLRILLSRYVQSNIDVITSSLQRMVFMTFFRRYGYVVNLFISSSCYVSRFRLEFCLRYDDKLAGSDFYAQYIESHYTAVQLFYSTINQDNKCNLRQTQYSFGISLRASLTRIHERLQFQYIHRLSPLVITRSCYDFDYCLVQVIYDMSADQ